MYKSLLLAAAVLSFASLSTSFSRADPLAAVFVDAFNKAKQGGKIQGGQGDLGGQNDEAQKFQQIMQQLSQQAAPVGEGSNQVPKRPGPKPRF